MITKEKIGDAKFMHCLPVRRNLIVEDAVLDSDSSLVIRASKQQNLCSTIGVEKNIGRFNKIICHAEARFSISTKKIDAENKFSMTK